VTTNVSRERLRAAIAKAHALKRMLQELAEQPEHGEGSPVAFALHLVDQVCSYIDDGSDDEDVEPQRPRLRLVQS
jgi:hypothetical protein